MQEKEQKISPIKQRILLFAENLNISKREFYKTIDVSRGTLESKTGLTEEIMAKFIANYPDVNINWLITGEGNMLRGDASQSIATESIPEKDLLITMLREKDKRIEELAAENALLKKEIDTLNNIAKKRSYDNDANLPIAAEPPVELNK